MKMKACFPKLLAVFVFCLCCTLAGCSSGKILSQTNNDDVLSMETQDYTDTVERTITIKNTQRGSFSVKISPTDGNVQITLTDGAGVKILSMNQDASLSDSPTVTEVFHGNGTYRLTVRLKQYSGSFNVSWTVDEPKGKDF